MEHLKNDHETAQAIAAAGDSFADDYQAVTHAAGVRILDGRKIVRVVGDDRATFFHGMCSADVKGAKPGSILPALILTEHAHVIAELFIWVADDALLLDIDADAWTRAREHLERLLVADDVEFEDDDALVVIDVEGPKSLAATGTREMPEPWRFTRKDGAIVGNLPRYDGPAVAILESRAKAPSIIASILAAVPGSRLVDSAVLDAIRIEHGVALIGVDTVDKTIALEARLNRSISFNKGCYVGQETIERATARGGLKKRMFGLKFMQGRVPMPGAVVSLAGKEVGRVSSSIRSPRFGAIGLGILHHSAWTAGTTVTVGDDGTATVSELPFGQD